MKTVKRILRFVLIPLAVLVAGMLLLLCFLLVGSSGSESTQDIAYYQALSGETEGSAMLPIDGEVLDIPCPYELPFMEELEPYQTYQFDYTEKWGLIFQSHAYILIVQYDEQVYQEKKALLNTEYQRLTDGITGETEALPPEFQMDGFDFCAIDGGWYPKYMFFVGTSDVDNEIAYIYYYDQDLDYVSPSVSEFIQKNSGWDELIG